MKSRFSKTLSFMLAVILCVSALTVPAYATDAEPDLSLPAKSVSRSGNDGPMLVDGLVNIGDTKTYEMEIDHALFPEAILYALQCHHKGI